MKICFVYGGKDRTDGGLGFLRNLSLVLRREGHVCVAILGECKGLLLKGAVDQEIQIGLNWSLGLKRKQRLTIRKLRKAILDISPDVIHIIHPCGGFGYNGHIHALPIVWRDAPTVVTFWGLNIGPKSNWLARLSFLTLLWGANLVAAHDFDLIAILRKISLYTRRIEFLPIGSNVIPSPHILRLSRVQLRLQHGLDLDTRYISYFGGFDESRGLDELFRAVKLLSRRRRDRVRLLMIGWQRHVNHPAFTHVKTKIEQEGIVDLIEMTPYAEPNVVVSLLRASDVCVLPFRSNPVGRSSLMAALAAGVPVVLGVRRRDLGPLTNGVKTVRSGRVEDLIGAIEELLDDSSYASELGSRGHWVWSRYFNWDVIAWAHIRAYQKVIKGIS
ncbi:MAG TPA: glycosyltransferase [Desulfobacterales bacterium]|nr:glycosyltransferase [Desulfobacterales bacterium]